MKKRKQSSFEKRCDTAIGGYDRLLEAKPKFVEVPPASDAVNKQLAAFRYPGEVDDQAKRIEGLQRFGEVSDGKGARVKLIKANDTWFLLGF